MTRIKKLIVEGALSSFSRFYKFNDLILLRLIKPTNTAYYRAGCELLIDGRQQQIKILIPYFINSIISYFVKY